MPKKDSFYSKELPTPAKTRAGSNPLGGSIAVGAAKPPQVPAHEGVIHGLGTPSHAFKQASVKGSHGYGHVAKHRVGALRLSGSAKAHQLGKK